MTFATNSPECDAYFHSRNSVEGVYQLLKITDPEHVQPILHRPLFARSPLMERIAGPSMVWLNGERWRERRRLAQRFFQPARLKEHEWMFELAVEGLLGRMQTAADQGSSICLTEEFLRMTTRFLYRFAFGITLDEDHEKAVLVSDFFDAIGSAAFDIASIDTPMDNENVRRHRSARLAMDAEVDEIISQCQDQDCVLRSFLDASARDGGLSIEDVRAEIMGLFLAGTETTSLTLAWLFLLLDAHPAFCERVIAEQDAGTGSMELEAAVFETLRLFPPVPFLTRIVEEPVELDSLALEVGTVLLVSIYHLHRNPKHWSEPEVFNPARFHDMQDRHRYAFLPFGGGRHLCIGQNIAVKETLCAASAILKRFTLKRIDDQPIVARMGLTLKPATQVRVRPVVRA